MNVIFAVITMITLTLSAFAEPSEYTVQLLPSRNGYFVTVLGPEGFMKEIGRPGESQVQAYILAQKLEKALNNGTVKWAELDWELVRHLGNSINGSDHMSPENQKILAKIKIQELPKKYMATIAPMEGGWTNFILIGPEGSIVNRFGMEASRDANGVALSYRYARNLEGALNSGLIQFSDVDYRLLRVLSEPPFTTNEAEVEKLVAIVRNLTVDTYTSVILPSSSEWFTLSVSGPEGVNAGISYHYDNNLSTSVVQLQKLQEALQLNQIKWQNVNIDLFRALSSRPGNIVDLEPTVKKIYDIIQAIQSPVEYNKCFQSLAT